MSETKKQVIDQSAHALWGLATGATFVVDLEVSLVRFLPLAAACGSSWFWTHRERLQFRDGAHVWWDPLLDNGVFWASVCAGAVAVRLLS